MNIRSLIKLTDGAFTEEEAVAAAAQTERYILAYCGLCRLPRELETLALSMAAVLLRSGAGAGVRSVKMGDAEVSFGDGSADPAQTVLSGYRPLLNRYRRVRWH